MSTAIEVPRLTALNTRGNAQVTSLSCGSPNYCVAGGSYAPSIESPYQAFVVREKNGSWGTAIEVPGLVALNADGNAGVLSVSCRLARYCAAGGNYTESSGNGEAFVVSRT